MGERPNPCPCCGYLVFSESPGSYDICPICFWEDDASQLRFPLMGGGANEVSLLEAQKNFAAFGASESRLASHVRSPRPDEQRDPSWRPFDPVSDDIAKEVPGVEYGQTYPKDRTTLYYWRATYWRRRRSPGAKG